MSAKQRQLQDRLSRPRAIDPDAPVVPEPAPVSEPEPEPARPPARRRSTALARRLSAVEDPEYLPGRMGYRSFYVEDSIYARFRAAIYWAARRMDAEDEGVPVNMSVAVSAFLQGTAEHLERQFNGGEVFPMPPPAKRRRKG